MLLSSFLLDFGVFTTKKFQKGDFLLEYPGDLISDKEGRERVEKYDPSLGSYLFFYEKTW